MSVRLYDTEDQYFSKVSSKLNNIILSNNITTKIILLISL